MFMSFKFISFQSPSLSLNVCLLGVPNAGKSSLVNAICGYEACPYSKKVRRVKYEAIISIILYKYVSIIKEGEKTKCSSVAGRKEELS